MNYNSLLIRIFHSHFYLPLGTSAFSHSISPPHLNLPWTYAFYPNNVPLTDFYTLLWVKHPSRSLLPFFPFLYIKLFVVWLKFTALYAMNVIGSVVPHKSTLATNFTIIPAAPRPLTSTIQTTPGFAKDWNVVTWHRATLTLYNTNDCISSMIWSHVSKKRLMHPCAINNASLRLEKKQNCSRNRPNPLWFPQRSQWN